MGKIINITQRGSFNRTERYLRRLDDLQVRALLDKYGNLGVVALAGATPVESGLTAQAWFYTIVTRPGYYSIRWHNSHTDHGIPIAVILQYGHGTRNGGYVQGRDYIMPAIKPVFEQLMADVEKEVT